MTRSTLHRSVLAALFMLGFISVTTAEAEQKFKPNVVISSQTGKWKQAINEKPVKKIDCQVVRVSGGDDTFINFRFGDDGKTFPNGQRFQVTKSDRMKFSVPGNGIQPNGKPLVINAYKGSVKITHVTGHYQ